MEDLKVLKTIDEIRTFSDPYRLQILQQFQSFGVPATVKQVADRMKEVPANVYYHVKKMEKADILKLVYTKNINGIIAKFYEPSAAKFDIGVENAKEPAKKLLYTEAQKTVSNVYDSSKDVIFREFEKRKAEGKGRVDFQMLMETLYLTEDQYKEIYNYISNLCESNNKKADGKNPYHFLSVIGRITD